MTSRGIAEGLIDLLWAAPKQSARGPKRSLSVSQIAEAAVLVADREGIEAVSMQRVAADLDVTKMSLYRYVDGKSELLAAMVEIAVGEAPNLARVSGGWRPKIARWAGLLAQTWEKHSWLPWVTVGDRVMGPREVAWIEVAVRALAQTPLTPCERMDAVLLLCGHIRNTQTKDLAGTQPWNNQRQLALVRGRSGEFPALAAIEAQDASTPAQSRQFGLDRILDGLEVLIDSRRTGKR